MTPLPEALQFLHQGRACTVLQDGFLQVDKEVVGCDFLMEFTDTALRREVQALGGLYKLEGCRGGYPYYVHHSDQQGVCLLLRDGKKGVS